MLEFEIGQWRWSGPEGLGHIGVDAERALLSHPDAIELICYWEQKRRGEEIPEWKEIRPREIARLLPFLLLAEPRGDDWFYRLFGSVLATRSGVEWTNHLVSEIYTAKTARDCAHLYKAVTAGRKPIHLRGCYLGIGIEHKTMEAVHLPVIGRDRATVWVFGGVFFL